jgi:hypothetical protein
MWMKMMRIGITALSVEAYALLSRPTAVGHGVRRTLANISVLIPLNEDIGEFATVYSGNAQLELLACQLGQDQELGRPVSES